MATPLSLTFLRLCRSCFHNPIHVSRNSLDLPQQNIYSRTFSFHFRSTHGTNSTVSRLNRTNNEPTKTTRLCCSVSNSRSDLGHLTKHRFYRTRSVCCDKSQDQTDSPLSRLQSTGLRGKYLLRNKVLCCAPLHFTNWEQGFHVSCSLAKDPLDHPDGNKGRTTREDLRAKQKQFKAAIKSRVADLSEDIRTVPNLLTLLRMLSAPVLGSLVIHEHFSWALCLFVFAGITDLMDGYIARNFKNQKSVLGTMMDPLADKLLMTVLALSLTMVDLIPVPLVALIISRDIGLIGAAFYIRYLSLPPPKTIFRYFDLTLPTAKLYPSNLSKVNTALQLSLVALTLAAPVFNYVDHPYLQALWCITALTTFSSGVQYVLSSKSFFKILQKNKSENDFKSPKR